MIKTKQLIAAAMAAVVTISATVFSTTVNAADEYGETVVILDDVLCELEESYSEYYDINNTKVTLYSTSQDDGVVENLYCVSLDVILKADSVEDLDYYQGVEDFCSSVAIMNIVAAGEDSAQLEAALDEIQGEIYGNLAEHIGEEQELVFFVKEFYSEDNSEEKSYLFENGEVYVELSEILPVSQEELREHGYEQMSAEFEECIENLNVQNDREDGTQGAAVLQSYSVSSAVAYMTTYTSNPTSCEFHSSCDMYVDTSVYNSNYVNYASSHSDCANYISQALCAGGIPVSDSTWKAASTAWINVSSLTSYMVGKGYWTSVSYSNAKLGDIISLSSGSHVIMITSYDGVTYKYSGHTNDRLNATISLSSSTGTFYRTEYEEWVES